MAVELTVGHGCLPAGSFGLALTLQPLLDARAAGHTVAVLQAATQGVRIYERIGFQAFGGITEYKPLKVG